MAASVRINPVILNHRVFLTSAFFLLIAFLFLNFGTAYTFVVFSVSSVALLWYFYTEKWIRPFGTHGKCERDDLGLYHDWDLPYEKVDAKIVTDPVQPQSAERTFFNFTGNGNLATRTLHVKRNNPHLNEYKPLTSPFRQRTTCIDNNSIVNKPKQGRVPDTALPMVTTQSPNFFSEFVKLTPTASPYKIFKSPREMSFSSSFLYSPNKCGSPNGSICHTSHRNYPTHQPEYSGLGQLPLVRWNDTSSSPVWKRRANMQSPVMVKIAPLDTVRSESPLVQSMVEENEAETADTCKKESVIAAIRECRKRGVTDDRDDSSSTTSSPWEQGNKRRRVDESSRCPTPSVDSSFEYETAPPSIAESVSSLNSNVPGPKGVLSRTPRNAIISSFSSSKKLKKRKHPELDDHADCSPSKKPTLGLDNTSNGTVSEESLSEPNNSNKENSPETPKKSLAKRGYDGDDAERKSETPVKDDSRTPKKRSLRQLLARQKTPLKGVALLGKTTQLMTNSPGQYTAADLAEDRHMAKQRVNYIREALKEPEPPPVPATKPAVPTMTSSLISVGLTLGSGSSTETAGKPTSSDLLSALAKPATVANQSTISSQGSHLGISTTKTSSVPTLSSAKSIASVTGPLLTSSQSSGSKPSTSSSTVSLPGIASGHVYVSSGQTSTQAPNFGVPLSTATPALGAVFQPQTSIASVLSSSSSSKAPSLLSGEQQTKNPPTSSVSLLSQQIKSQDVSNVPNIQGSLGFPGLTKTSVAATSSSQTATTCNATTAFMPTTCSVPTASAATISTSIFNTNNTPLATHQLNTQTAMPAFTPIFSAASKVTTAQTSAPMFQFSGSSSTTSSSVAGGQNFKPIFSPQTQENKINAPSNMFSVNKPTSKPGGFQFNTSLMTSTSQAPVSTTFQFGSTNKPATTAPTSTTANKPASNLYTFNAQTTQSIPSLFGAQTTQSNPSLFGAQATQSNPSPFGAQITQTNPSPFGTQTTQSNPSLFSAQTAQSNPSLFGAQTTQSNLPPFGAQTTQSNPSLFGAQTTQSNPSPFGAASVSTSNQQSAAGIFGQSTNPSQSQNKTQAPFGSSVKPFSASTSQTTSTPFGGSSSSTVPNQNPFGGTAKQQSLNLFGGATQQTQNTFGTAGQQQTQAPFGGGSQTNSVFGGSTQPAQSAGVFAFGANNNKPNTSGMTSNVFSFGASATPTQQQQQQQSAPTGGFNFSSTAVPSSGFNFGTPGFGSAPPSGRSTPVGSFSVGASSATSSAAHRKARMRQARGRSGRR